MTRLWKIGSAAAGTVMLLSGQAAKPTPPENPPTRSITLPGVRTSANAAEPSRKASEPAPGGSTAAPGGLAANVILAPSAGDGEVEQHYKAAILALKDENLGIAAEEMNTAATMAPENALVLYGLAVVQTRNQQPELALANIEKAVRLGLPAKTSGEAEELVASIRYAIRVNAAEQKKVTPAKLWGTYEVPLDEPSQDTEDLPGRTVFKTRLPVSREMSLWKIDGEANVRGHWLEKNTYSEQTSYANSRRPDPKPKLTTEEHWWLLSVLINPDGSLDGSRIQTCFRRTGVGCEHGDSERGRAVTFKGHVEPNGDLSILLENSKEPLILKKKSRVSTLPPFGVGLRTDE